VAVDQEAGRQAEQQVWEELRGSQQTHRARPAMQLQQHQ